MNHDDPWHARRSPETRSSRIVGGLAAALLVLHVVLAWHLSVPGFSTGQDDAIYILLGRALRHFSYSDLWLVGHPVESRYPPLYPMVLALAGLVPGNPVTAGIALNIAFSAAALAVLFRMVRAWSSGLALLVLGAAAVNPALVETAGKVASEPLYMLLSLLALATLARRSSTPNSLITAGALAIAAALTRSIGVVLVLSLLLLWLLERRWRAVAWFALASGLTVGAWLTWTALAPGQLAGHSYFGDALLTGELAPAEESARPPIEITTPDHPLAPAEAESPAGAPVEPGPPAAPVAQKVSPSVLATLVARVRTNLPGYGVRGIPVILSLPTVPGITLDNWLWIVWLGVCGLLGTWTLVRAQPGAGLYLAGYAALLLLWPYRVTRFLTPVLPLLLVIFLLGAWQLLASRARKGRWVLPVAFMGVLIAAGMSTDAARWRSMRGCDREAPYNSAGCYAAEQLGFFAAVADLGRRVPQNAVLLTPKAATVFFLTGRQSVDELAAAGLDAATLDRFLRAQGVEYIMLSRIHLDQRTIAATLQRRCTTLELLSEPSRGILLLGIGWADSGRGEACAAIDRFMSGAWPEGP